MTELFEKTHWKLSFNAMIKPKNQLIEQNLLSLDMWAETHALKVGLITWGQKKKNTKFV